MVLTIIIIAVVLLLVVFFIAQYNGLVGARNLVDEAFSTMDVYLTKRFDLLPNLVATVKGYAKHECETLDKVMRHRSNVPEGDINGKVEAEAAISTAVRGLMVQVEAYPDLKANANFQDLQHQMALLEEDIASSRRYYNGTVREYNNKVQMFPGSLIAGMANFTTRKMYEVESAEVRRNVKVEF